MPRVRIMDQSTLLGRTFAIVEAFGTNDVLLSLADLSKRTDLPKSTVHRIANRLVAQQWLERVDSQYRLGIRLFELGQMFELQRFRLREIALPFMEDLYEATHEIVNLAVFDEGDMVYIEKISGHRRVPIETRLGCRMPAHCTALGKAVLAFADPEVVEKVIAEGLPAKTPRSITDPAALRKALKEINRQRFAVDRGEYKPNVVCVAAPIFNGTKAVAALSVTGPAERIDVRAVSTAVQTATLGISRMLRAQADARKGRMRP
jgi:DNA-binding IclR family transcriptional regulator